MILFRLAFRNIKAAGLRTWLNTFVISLTFFAIIFLQGMYNGMYEQMVRVRIDDELGHGQYWHKNYDPFDPLTLEESHAPLPSAIQPYIQKKEAVPVLMVPAAIYPQGRLQSVVLKGIPSNQTILKLPTSEMQSSMQEIIPIMMGERMAKQTDLAIGDTVTARWRTNDGAFDALELELAHIFKTDVPAVDFGQIWLPLEHLQQMFDVSDHATIIIMQQEAGKQQINIQWDFHSLETLLADTKQFVQSKNAGGSIFFSLLLFLAMIAILDTQALSIFKRRKEIGTLMALGMTPEKVLGLFTLEGVMQGFFAAFVTAIWGGPIFWYMNKYGIRFSVSGDQYGLALSEILYPAYTFNLFAGAFMFVMVLLVIVSYWPVRHISRLLPSDALRGR